MTPLYVTSDWHLGAIRSGGVTPSTAYQLRQELISHFGAVLDNIEDGNLLLNGDLLDGPNIPMADLAQVFALLSNWLSVTKKKLWLPPGNHDLSKSSTTFSSFQFLAKLLTDQFPTQVEYIEGGKDIGDGCYVVSHVANQSLLELELSRVPQCRYAFFHANFANVFAQEADHSLTISEDQVRALPCEMAVFGHEHVGRTEMGGRVLIVGNPTPSSISDCLGDKQKHLIKITDAGVEFIQTWAAEGDYQEIDWRELEDTGARFIRATGTATAEEADKVVTAISKFRQKSTCLVLGNAVKVEGVNDQEDLALTHEQITAFSVRDALRELLTREENEKIDNLQMVHD